VGSGRLSIGPTIVHTALAYRHRTMFLKLQAANASPVTGTNQQLTIQVLATELAEARVAWLHRRSGGVIKGFNRLNDL
jgi:hypothetical protein